MSNEYLELPDGTRLAIDEKGYLLEAGSWTPDVTRFMATIDQIVLIEDHWEIIDIFQVYFREFDIEPPMRALVRLTRERLCEEKGSSRYLYLLFPDGPTLQASRYGGLPRPLSCI